MITYEQQLSNNLDWALREGSMYFEEKSAVHQTLRRLAKRLDQLGIPYVFVGGMALFYHGVRRFTEDVDLLVTRESLNEIHSKLEGLGYVPPFEGSKNLRDTESGVKIEFLVTGDYPGYGLPKPVAFPDPADSGIAIEGFRFLKLPQLIELKLASGMTNPRRGQDLIDVQRIIETLDLPEDYADHLNPYVQDQFKNLWTVVHTNPP